MLLKTIWDRIFANISKPISVILVPPLPCSKFRHPVAWKQNRFLSLMYGIGIFYRKRLVIPGGGAIVSVRILAAIPPLRRYIIVELQEYGRLYQKFLNFTEIYSSFWKFMEHLLEWSVSVFGWNDKMIMLSTELSENWIGKTSIPTLNVWWFGFAFH